MTWAATEKAADMVVSVYEFDVAIDAEVPRDRIPYVPGVGDCLIDKRFGAEAGTLLNAPRRHRQARSRPTAGNATGGAGTLVGPAAAFLTAPPGSAGPAGWRIPQPAGLAFSRR